MFDPLDRQGGPQGPDAVARPVRGPAGRASFGSAILKLTAFCNLDCTYCYMFNLADRTWARVPRMMSEDSAGQAVRRIEEYVASRGLRKFAVVLHGGEPTLWPVPQFRNLLERLAAVARSTGCRVEVALQTNAVEPLSEELVALLCEHHVSVGISLDGPKAHNDRFRVNHAGRGSYDLVLATVADLVARGHQDLIGGFLSVASPDIAPRDYLDWVRTLPVTRVDVLWPIQFNHTTPPWGDDVAAYADHPAYGSWFAELFDAWWELDDPTVQIRLFNNLVALGLGGRDHIDALVNDQLDMLVINTDGGYELPDYFRALEDGRTRTGMSVDDTALEALHDLDSFGELFDLASHLPHACASCPVVDVCGGGFLPGRVGARGGSLVLDERSVLCFDHFHLYSRVASRLAHAASAIGA